MAGSGHRTAQVLARVAGISLPCPSASRCPWISIPGAVVMVGSLGPDCGPSVAVGAVPAAGVAAAVPKIVVVVVVESAAVVPKLGTSPADAAALDTVGFRPRRHSEVGGGEAGELCRALRWSLGADCGRVALG